ncbi:MAG: helix-turn-helix domain-containing protein [Dysgonomonas sp.]
MNGLDIKKLREEKGWTQKDLASRIGVSLKTVTNYETGGKIPESKIPILNDVFYAGNENKKDSFLETSSGVKYFELPGGLYRMRVPFVPIEAYAKYIDEYRDVDFIDGLDEIEFIVRQVEHGRYCAFQIKGDSMDDGSINSIPHGSFVLGRELNRDLWCDGNGLRVKDYPYWIIVMNNTILCKEIVDQKNNIITCHSLNQSPEYASDFEIDLNKVRQLFNIVTKTMFP